MIANYDPKYLEFLKADKNIIKVAELIETIKQAAPIFLAENHFSQTTTQDILQKAFQLSPSAGFVELLLNLEDRFKKNPDGGCF